MSTPRPLYPLKMSDIHSLQSSLLSDSTQNFQLLHTHTAACTYTHTHWHIYIFHPTLYNIMRCHQELPSALCQNTHTYHRARGENICSTSGHWKSRIIALSPPPFSACLPSEKQLFIVSSLSRRRQAALIAPCRRIHAHYIISREWRLNVSCSLKPWELGLGGGQGWIQTSHLGGASKRTSFGDPGFPLTLVRRTDKKVEANLCRRFADGRT